MIYIDQTVITYKMHVEMRIRVDGRVILRRQILGMDITILGGENRVVEWMVGRVEGGGG